MLVIKRMPGQTIMIGDSVEITVEAMDRDFVTLRVRPERTGGVQDGQVEDQVEVLERDQSFRCCGLADITVVAVRPDGCFIAVSRSGKLMIHRKEVYEQIRKENDEAGGGSCSLRTPW